MRIDLTSGEKEKLQKMGWEEWQVRNVIKDRGKSNAALGNKIENKWEQKR